MVEQPDIWSKTTEGKIVNYPADIDEKNATKTE